MYRIILSCCYQLLLALSFSSFLLAQNKPLLLSLPAGKHAVGFKKYTKDDLTRSYTRLYDWDGAVTARPMSISLWYPAVPTKGKKPLLVKDYMEVLKQEEEWEDLPNDKILSWFYYADSPTNRSRMNIPTNSFLSAPPFRQKMPVILYAPSYQASSIENFALCELLASHGYLVLASPSRGTENRLLSGGTTKDIETQARDIEFLIQQAALLPDADLERLAVAGFSFGGLSNVLAAMKDKRIKALVSLDGSVKYQFDKLLASPYTDISRFDIPFLFMSQKDIPLAVMKEDKIDTTLNNRFAFFDSLRYSEAYYLKFNDLTHPYFSSLGILFAERDARQDKSDLDIVASYQWMARYTLAFLDAYLKGDEKARQFMGRSPEENGLAPGILTSKAKQPLPRGISFEAFHRRARQQHYRDLPALCDQLKQENPGMQFEEWKINNLGLQLLMKGKLEEGIQVLELNTFLFPHSGNSFDSLAEGYLMQNKKALAIQSFQKSLELNPQNQNAIDQLQRLGK